MKTKFEFNVGEIVFYLDAFNTKWSGKILSREKKIINKKWFNYYLIDSFLRYEKRILGRV